MDQDDGLAAAVIFEGELDRVAVLAADGEAGMDSPPGWGPSNLCGAPPAVPDRFALRLVDKVVELSLAYEVDRRQSAVEE